MKNVKSMTDKEKIKSLKEACRSLIGFVPDGWPMPIGYGNLVEKISNLIEAIK